MKVLLVLVVSCVLIYSEAKPANYDLNEFGDFLSEDDGTSVSECHGISCPSGTVACSKTVKTSSDKRTLMTTLQCEDIQGNILNSEIKSSENPFENTQISSFSFTGHYNYQGGNSIVTQPRPTYQNTYYNNNNDEVETFK